MVMAAAAVVGLGPSIGSSTGQQNTYKNTIHKLKAIFLLPYIMPEVSPKLPGNFFCSGIPLLTNTIRQHIQQKAKWCSRIQPHMRSLPGTSARRRNIHPVCRWRAAAGRPASSWWSSWKASSWTRWRWGTRRLSKSSSSWREAGTLALSWRMTGIWS